MSRATLCVLRGWLCAAGLCCTAVASAQGLSMTIDEPRAFGHFVGDIVTRRIVVLAAPPLALDAASLPQLGRRGSALELRRLDWQRGSGPDGRARYELRLDYQVFLAPTEARVLELPPLPLRFTGGPRAEEVRADAWPLVVAPLAPVEASPREGLGELRPDRASPLIDTRATRLRLAAYAALALPLAAYLASIYLVAPWWLRRHRPFGNAWREVRTLPADPSLPQLQAAIRRVHEAFNRSAGHVLFERGIDGFVAAAPRFAPLHDQIAAFFERSREAFFGRGSDTRRDAAWLVEFCRRCRDVERGAA
jgi:mxaA protein